MSKGTDLNIRVVSNLSKTQQVLMYQEDIQTNVKNFKVAAWEHPYIAPKSHFDVVLPMAISIAATDEIGRGCLTTKALNVDYNTAWEIFDNNGAIDVCSYDGSKPTENTIEVYNNCESTKSSVVTKDGKPLFACEVRPEFKVNFAIHPKLYIALSDMEIHEEFFDAATLSRKPEIIDYEGQQYVTITLDEDVSTGKVTITYSFDKFI